jgi:hypothetical protein
MLYQPRHHCWPCLTNRVTRRLEKITQVLEKVAQRVAKPKNGTIVYITPSELYKYSQQIIFSTKKISGPLKSSPNGEISPNVVTLIVIDSQSFNPAPPLSRFRKSSSPEEASTSLSCRPSGACTIKLFTTVIDGFFVKS